MIQIVVYSEKKNSIMSEYLKGIRDFRMSKVWLRDTQ